MKPPYAIGSVSSLSGHANVYRWRSLPRASRHKASKPQGSSERVLAWQVAMDQLLCASFSHIHYWYKVGILKVPAGERGPNKFAVYRLIQCTGMYEATLRTTGSVPVDCQSVVNLHQYSNARPYKLGTNHIVDDS